MNIEYGAFIFRDLNMTIITYSKSVNVTSLAIFKVIFSTHKHPSIPKAVKEEKYVKRRIFLPSRKANGVMANFVGI